MLSHEDNQMLCRVGQQTPMGKMMRQYWIPAAMSDEVVPDGAPKRVRLLGEDLIVFRDTKGRVGLLDEFCPHRAASLVIGRNEECGLRCLYHGLKVDVTGRVVDMPAEAPEHGYTDRVRAIAYRTHEAGGVIWAYMGPADQEPPPMNFHFTSLPNDHRVVLKFIINANWLQAIEGVIDSAHSNFLHSDTFKPTAGAAQSNYDDNKTVTTVMRPSNDGHPRLDSEVTSYGFRYAAIRKPLVDPDTTAYVRVTLFVAPIYGLFPAPSGWSSCQAFVPMDDEHTMLYFFQAKLNEPISEAEKKRHLTWSGLRVGVDLDNDFRMFRNRENNWLQDRERMQAGDSFSGVTGVQIEDAMVQESMGPIANRTKENLGTSDVAIVRLRRLMLDSVRKFAKTGERPLGLAKPVDYGALHAGEGMMPLKVSWREHFPV
jgi:phthalate 4,5-dioxygenase oxygenase subunit